MAVDYTRLLERRYLLGDTTDEERNALEERYFHDPEAMERVEAAEDELIEAYLAEELTSDERRRFERDYLESPAHRQRLEVIRGLEALAARPEATPATREAATPLAFKPARGRGARSVPGTTWWALAAAAAVVLAAATWIMMSRSVSQPAQAPQSAQATTPAPQPAPNASTPSPAPSATPPATTPAPVAAPRVFAFSLSSVSVRAVSGSRNLVIPPNTDVINLTLEDAGAGDAKPITAARVFIRTPGDDEIWRGAAIVDPSRAPAIRVEVPAARLQPDDYIVIVTAGGREIAHYVLHVRAR